MVTTAGRSVGVHVGVDVGGGLRLYVGVYARVKDVRMRNVQLQDRG